MAANATNASYYGPIPTGTAIPPYEIGSAIGLDTEGGDYAPFRSKPAASNRSRCRMANHSRSPPPCRTMRSW